MQKERRFLNEGAGDFWMTGRALTNRRWISLSTIENKTHWATSCSTACYIVQNNKGSTVWSHNHTNIDQTPHMVGDLPQRLSLYLAQQKWREKKKKLVMHTPTFLFPVSLVERASCGSWLHNHSNTTHLEPNKVRVFHQQLRLNSCTTHFAKTTHPNVIPGQQQLTNTLITWHEMWASHIHNIPLPQQDTGIGIKKNAKGFRRH